MTIPPELILAKNKLAGDVVWLATLEINIVNEATIRLVNNNEDIVWMGDTFKAMAFEIDTIREDGQGGLPSYGVKVSNITRELSAIVDSHAGATDAQVIFRVISSEHLNEPEPLFLDETVVIGTSVSQDWVVFTLGAQSPLQMLSPRERYLANHCRYKEFKGAKCGYAGTDGSCNRTFADCRAKGNSQRFGGFPAISQGQGVYV